MQLVRWIIRLPIISIVLWLPIAGNATKLQQQLTSSSLTPAQSITFDQIDDYVKRFSDFGLHRSGSRIDRRTANWLKTTLKRDKLDVVVDSFHFRRPVSRYAVVSMKVDRINSVILPGMPLFNAKPTNRHVKAKLGFVGQKGIIPVIHIYVTPSSGSAALRAKSLKEFKDAVESGRYKAVIGVTQGGYAGLVPLTVDLNKHYKTPAMLMSSEIGNYAEIYAEINSPVKFLTRIHYQRSKAENIVAKIKGSQPSLSPIVVIAPRSAWWYAAAERGTSVASWLAAAKALVKKSHKRTIIFVSTTGQEFYSMGLKRFLQSHLKLEKEAFAWIYIGANIGTKPQPHYIVQSSSPSMQRQVRRVFADYDINKVRWLASSPVVLPAFASVLTHSSRAIIVAATNNKCVRMTCDKWPSAVNIDATLHFAKALTTLVDQLAAEGSADPMKSKVS